MQYTLMHKEVPVVDIELDDATGSIYQIKKVYNAEHIPIGIPYKNEVIDRKALNNWWYGRIHSGEPSRYSTGTCSFTC